MDIHGRRLMSKQAGKKEYAIAVIQKILEYPSMVVPQLDDSDILAVMSDALRLYQEKELDLAVLTNVADTIHIFMGMRKSNIGVLLNEIRSLPQDA